MRIKAKPGKFILGETEPTCRTLKTDEGKVFVSLPYVTYLLRPERELYVSFRNKPTKKLSARLRWTGLPNIGGDGDVCMGDIRFSKTPTVEGLKKVIGKFWMSEFTWDDGEEWDGPDIIEDHFDADGLFEGYRAWQRA